MEVCSWAGRRVPLSIQRIADKRAGFDTECGKRAGLMKDSVRRPGYHSSKLPGAQDDIWAAVEPFIVPGRELKAQYAFADLWEAERGHR